MRLKGKGDNDKSVSATPRQNRASAAVPSIVSPEMTVTGNLVSSGEVQIDGLVDGDVQAESLTVGEQGQINGTVQAGHLRVLGHIDGEIHADNVTVLASARVNGDVVHESLAIEAGAMIEGHCRRRSQDKPGQVGASVTTSVAAAEHHGQTPYGASNGQSGTPWESDGKDAAKLS
jgi:cytoskeletal protein CcmA (bactofilin family)